MSIYIHSSDKYFILWKGHASQFVSPNFARIRTVSGTVFDFSLL